MPTLNKEALREKIKHILGYCSRTECPYGEWEDIGEEEEINQVMLAVQDYIEYVIGSDLSKADVANSDYPEELIESSQEDFTSGFNQRAKEQRDRAGIEE